MRTHPLVSELRLKQPAGKDMRRKLALRKSWKCRRKGRLMPCISIRWIHSSNEDLSPLNLGPEGGRSVEEHDKLPFQNVIWMKVFLTRGSSLCPTHSCLRTPHKRARWKVDYSLQRPSDLKAQLLAQIQIIKQSARKPNQLIFQDSFLSWLQRLNLQSKELSLRFNSNTLKVRPGTLPIWNFMQEILRKLKLILLLQI